MQQLRCAPRGPCHRRPPGAAIAHGPDHPERHGFGERVRVADRSDSSEWVIASIAGRGRRGRRQPDGQAGSRIVAPAAGWVADVSLAAGGLVGDDPEAVGLGAGPAVVGTATMGRPGSAPVVVAELPDRRRLAAGATAPSPCPSRTRRRPRRRPSRRGRIRAAQPPPRSTTDAPGSARRSAKRPVRSRRPQDAEDRVDDPRRADARSR